MKEFVDLTDLDLREGDCLEHLKAVASHSIDLVFTSPPYAEQRKGKYHGTPDEEYIGWFLPIGYEIKRILKPSGSFLLNLQAHCDDGERQLYAMRLVIALRDCVHFKFIDEYVWYKSAMPRKKTYRLKNAWEPIYHFALGKPFVDHENIRVPSKSVFINKRGYTCYNDVTGNVGGFHDIADQAEGHTDPDNVLYFPTSLLVKDGQYDHPAKFPIELATFIVKAFSPVDGVVCDPFVGSGITALAALALGRKCIAMELEPTYCEMTLRRLREWQRPEIRGPKKVFDYANLEESA